MIPQILQLKKNGISVTVKASKIGTHYICIRLKRNEKRVDYEMNEETFKNTNLISRLLDDAIEEFTTTTKNNHYATK